MKLFYIALFTIQLRNIDAVSEPMPFKEHKLLKADCNDTGVLAAVDFALRKFNVEQKAGNKFALYRVTSAQTQVQEVYGLKYIVEFSIYETDCPIESTTLWKRCNYNKPKIASSGICDSETIINRIMRRNDVISLNCTVSQDHSWIFPEREPCLGCEKSMEADNHTLNKVSASVTEEFNRNRTFTNYFRIARVQKLSEQVVAGLLYRMEFLHRETECGKDQPLLYENVIKCPFKANGTRLLCSSTVIEKGWLNSTSATVTCQEITPSTFADEIWGPFMLLDTQTGNVRRGSLSETNSASVEILDSAEEHDLSTCPGEPWKSLHHVKPASPPNSDHHESHESAEAPADIPDLFASVRSA
ncbi:kininogen-1 [Hypanus sabinus]|uniref:kininogen-1 n=1 Tax=Hypanus sabinus TaxID=79690 RepID=UPI0028C46F3D|nr:kininogen-1 [Hypanus sabinus]